MEAQRVATFLQQNGKKFRPELLTDIRERLERMDDERYIILLHTSFQDPGIMLLVSIFGGGMGIDRFMIGQMGAGIGKLVLTSLCGIGVIWVIVDWFLIQRATKDANYEKLIEVSGYV